MGEFLMNKTICLTFLMVGAGVVSCGKDKKGDPLGLPQVKPPVERNTPSGLKSSSALRLQTETTPSALSTMGSRFFTKGPTSIMEILARIDQSMASLDQRAQEGTGRPPCLDEEAKSWTVNLPGGLTGTYYFQCFEERSSPETNTSGKTAFGVSGEYAYLVDLQDSTGQAPRTASLVKAKMDGTMTEAWITMQKFDNSQTVSNDDFFFLNVKADDTSKAFEFSVGGTGKGIGVDCGTQVKSNGTLIYGTGVFASFGDRGVETCTGVVTAPTTGKSDTNVARANLCVNASTLTSVADSQCDSMKSFSVPTLNHLDLKATGKALSSAIIDASITGVSTFKPKD